MRGVSAPIRDVSGRVCAALGVVGMFRRVQSEEFERARDLVVAAAQEISYAMGSHLFSDRFHVDIYTCPQCGHVELFAAKAELVNCPKCGTPHPANEKCPICALDTVLDGKYGR